MKTSQLQIRLSPAQKGLLKRRAAAAGQGVSAYVLSRIAPDAAVRVEEALRSVRESDGGPFALASFGDVIASLSPAEFAAAVAGGLPDGLSPLTRNQLTAEIEHAAVGLGVAVPSWAEDVPPLESPWFATELVSLRAHLLRASPVAFRRRNLFVDATAKDRV